MSPESDRPDRASTSALDRHGTRLLNRLQVADLLGLDECITAVEEAMRAHAEGRTIPPEVLSARVDGGAFHVKAAGLVGERPYFAAKLNGNFYGNAERFGLPRIQGLLILCDAVNGFPLAVMDSTEITVRRTGAATAVAAKHLARADSTVATIWGCGLQGRIQLAALCRVRPIRKVYAYDVDPAVTRRFAGELGAELSIEITPVEDPLRACRESQVCVTCTPSREPLLGPGDVQPGAFIAAVGSDSDEKQELEAELLRSAAVVVDHLEQCAAIGELHHALDRGLLTRSDVRAELHQVVAGERPGRVSAEEVLVFDSTGVALQDVAAAALVYERAQADGVGAVVEIL